MGRKQCLLLIREESEMISRQLSQWVDIVMFVFSYSSPTSLDRLLDINSKFRNYRSDLQPDPHILLVGVVGKSTQSPSLSLSFSSSLYLCLCLSLSLSLPSSLYLSLSLSLSLSPSLPLSPFLSLFLSLSLCFFR